MVLFFLRKRKRIPAKPKQASQKLKAVTRAGRRYLDVPYAVIIFLTFALCLAKSI
jgi:hypothetical protein